MINKIKLKQLQSKTMWVRKQREENEQYLLDDDAYRQHHHFVQEHQGRRAEVKCLDQKGKQESKWKDTNHQNQSRTFE